MSCHLCRGRSDWDFLADFYRRENDNKQERCKLEWDLHYISQALNQSSHSAQNDRKTLLELQSQLTEAQNLVTAHDVARGKAFEQLEEERLEHRGTREALRFEQERHGDTTKYLEVVYQTMKRAGAAIDSIKEHSEENSNSAYAVLTLENELKKQEVEELTDTVKVKEQKYKLDISEMMGRLKREEERCQSLMQTLEEKEIQIAELCSITQNDQTATAGLATSEELLSIQETPCRKRRRGARRARKEKGSEA